MYIRKCSNASVLGSAPPAQIVGSGYIPVVLLLFLLLQFGSAHCSAQIVNGGIDGHINDVAGHPISNAQVTLTNQNTGTTKQTSTTSIGSFVIQELPVGHYRLVASSIGFANAIIADINVAVGVTSHIEVKLPVAGINETITVAAPTATLDTESANSTTVVSATTVQNLPLNGRDFTQLSKLVPGVNYMNSVNGSRFGQNQWQIDGVEAVDLFWNITSVNGASVSSYPGGIPSTILPIDSIDQFSVTSGGSAEYGGETGGAFHLALKSGTNAPHGSIYYFNRNDALAVTPPFSATKPKLKNSQFGGSVGGPLVRNKLFYFGSYETQRMIIGNSRPGTEPSDAYVTAANAVLAKYNVSNNPVSLNLLKFWPDYGRTGPASINNFTPSANQEFNSNNGLAKLDYALNSKHALSARLFYGQGKQSFVSTSVYPEYYQVTPTRAYNGGLTWAWYPSTHFVNQIVVGINYIKHRYYEAATTFNPIAAGLNTGVTDPALAGSPDITVGGFDRIGRVAPLEMLSGTAPISDTATYALPRHQIRFGMTYRRGGANVFYRRNQRGVFTFNGTQGPWKNDARITDANVRALADFLAGYVATSSIVRGNVERDFRQNAIEAFAQDKFALTPHLSLDYGLHYSYYSPLNDPTNSTTTFIPSLGGIVAPGANLSSLYPRAFTNFGPRVGLAFSPASLPRLVFHLGGGLFFSSPDYGTFVDQSVGNTGGGGLVSNPGGSSPVYAISRASYTIVANQPIFGGVNPAPPFGILSVSQSYKNNSSLLTRAEIEYGLSGNSIVKLAYVGTFARHLPLDLDINQARPSATGNATTIQQALATRPFYATFPMYGAINEISTVGNSNYHSLQFSFEMREWKGLTARASYTYGHALDNVTLPRYHAPQNSLNLADEYGNSELDIKHTVTGTLSYSLPAVRRVPAWLGSGWHTNAIVSAFTGLPFTVYTGQNNSGTFEGADRPNVIGDPFQGVSHEFSKQGVKWFNTNAFAVQPAGTFGNERRNSYRAAGFADVDLSLFKTFKIGEKVSAQFRVEMFNIFNRVNLAPPGAGSSNTPVLSSSSAALITQTMGALNKAPGLGSGEPYNTQIALKIMF